MMCKNYLRAALGLLILIFILPVSQAQKTGFFLDDWEERTADIPGYKTVEKTENEASFIITVDKNEELNKVPKYIYGHNYATWDNYNGLMENATGRQDVINLNPHVIRWPGGSLSDNYFWDTPYGQKPSDVPSNIDPWYGTSTNTSWHTSLNDYYDMLAQINATGCITVNYGYARYGTGPNPVNKAAHMAADWVRHDNGRTKFWEIGNENFGDWESGYEIDLEQNQDGQPQFISGTLYGQHCKVFIDSMRAAAAEIGVDIKIGAVVFDAETSWQALQTNWNEQMMLEVGDVADFLSVHSYFSPYDSDSPADVILNTYTVPENIMSVLVDDMAEASQTMLPVAMTEWNIWAAGSMQQVSHINGLLATMVLGEFIKNDYGMGNRWDFINGWNNGDTHALFSTDDEPGVDLYNPRAPFFYMYFFQKYFGDRMIGLSHNGNSNIVAYASSFSSGETSLAIVNKGSSEQTNSNQNENFEAGIRYYTMTLTGDDVTFSRKVNLNGIATDEEGGGPDNYASIKAHASEIEGGVTVDLPAYSAVFVMLDKKGPLSYVSSFIDEDPHKLSVKFSEAIKVNSATPAIEILADGTTPFTVTGVEIDASDNRILHVSVAEVVVRENTLTISYSGSEITSLKDLAVAPFSDMPVRNTLIGDPYAITFRLKNTESENVIKDCKVTFNGVVQNTDADGEVQFTEQTGKYYLSVEKILFSSIENLEISIKSDTTINLQLDSAYFEVALNVKDHSNDENLPYVNITGNGQTQKTDADGNALISIHGGAQVILFEKTNYTSYEEEFQIVSDTSLAVSLVASAADIKFSLRYKGQPVSGAEVTLDANSLLTNAAGVCTFKSIPLNSLLDYLVEKPYYFPVQGSLELHSDTTIELQMEKTVANIEFVVSAESGIILNAFATIDQDTSWLNAEGVGRFYNIPINQEYAYKLVSDNFSVARGTVFLEKDTSVYIVLTVGQESAILTAGLRMYPNPASNNVRLESSNSNIESVELIGITGKRFLYKEFSSPRKLVDLNLRFPDGVYFIKVKTEENYYSRKLVIQ